MIPHRPSAPRAPRASAAGASAPRRTDRLAIHPALPTFAALALTIAGCGASSEPEARTASRSAQTAAPSASASATEPSGPAAEPPTAPPEPEAAQALYRAFEARMTVWTRPDGTRVLSRRCREGPVPCRERLASFARLIAAAAEEHALDPFLLAALAMRESGLDPAALGRNREAGIVQLHPRGAGRDVRYVHDEAYRRGCLSRVDACQGPVLERGASTLAEAIERCGGLIGGLGAYATGHCTRRASHPQQVLQERDRLRELSEAAAEP